ncbi:pyruvate dehydrogenase E2 component (dihydrolipoamide acetyltransferase) [Steroidobacter denitrificans]|uniref:Dihydrolipoamide acetyltransferase component of pyruvate dehydrogenase complex n=1 Tax=Steroidobacter denitrificans TaxID=465721 RepID=A0A127F822_STEDE|nr:dihydrolipoamide acetyltransferase family protein [Steroidobacter denitrificans]AMN45758.1 pyruvate dehydrogenase E2 component (dihydrolipoamide acetyltransferase) [Steroidobacter denitrificans]
MHALTLPRLGQTMETGRIVEWLIEEGAEYVEGAIVYSIETDKTVLEVQATLPGKLLRKVAAADTELPVGALVGVAADPGEQASMAQVQSFIDDNNAVAAASAANVAAVVANEPETTATKPAAAIPRAMPRTKKLARELGVELAAIVAPSGPGGLITEDDVRRSCQSLGTDRPPDTVAAVPMNLSGARARSAVEKTIARQMTRSWAVPQFAQDVEIDAEALLARRGRLQAEGRDISLTALMLDALVTALGCVPECNATFDGEELIQSSRIDAAIAIATPRGLLVPVLRDCNGSDFNARTARLAQLTIRAREGNLHPDEMSGGTVTLSNLGASRVETGVPIINAPQVCLVFTGVIIDKPVARNGQLTIGKRMHVVNVYDHRVIDGITGSRFVDALTTALTSS